MQRKMKHSIAECSGPREECCRWGKVGFCLFPTWKSASWHVVAGARTEKNGPHYQSFVTPGDSIPVVGVVFQHFAIDRSHNSTHE